MQRKQACSSLRFRLTRASRPLCDGQKAEIVNCDVAFMGVWVEPGEHEIVFTYRTRGLTLGLLMSLAAALMLTVYTFMTRRRGM